MRLAMTPPAPEFPDADVFSLDVDLAEVTAEVPALRMSDLREERGVAALDAELIGASAADASSDGAQGVPVAVSRARPSPGESSLGEPYLGLLRQAAQVLRADVGADDMLRALFNDIREPLGVDAYFNFMVNHAGDALALASCIGVTEDQARTFARVELGQAVCGNVALKRAPVVMSGIQRSNDRRVQIVKNLGIRAVACNPMMAGDTLLGTLSFATRTRDEFEPAELAFFASIARTVALSYERARLVRELAAVECELDGMGVVEASPVAEEVEPIALIEMAPAVEPETSEMAPSETAPSAMAPSDVAPSDVAPSDVAPTDVALSGGALSGGALSGGALSGGALSHVGSGAMVSEAAALAAADASVESIEAMPLGAEVIPFAKCAVAISASADIPLGLIEAAPVSALEVAPLASIDDSIDVSADDSPRSEHAADDDAPTVQSAQASVIDAPPSVAIDVRSAEPAAAAGAERVALTREQLPHAPLIEEVPGSAAPRDEASPDEASPDEAGRGEASREEAARDEAARGHDEPARDEAGRDEVLALALAATDAPTLEVLALALTVDDPPHHEQPPGDVKVESEITVELCALDLNSVRVPTVETPVLDLSAAEISALDLRPVETVDVPVRETPRASRKAARSAGDGDAAVAAHGAREGAHADAHADAHDRVHGDAHNSAHDRVHDGAHDGAYDSARNSTATGTDDEAPTVEVKALAIQQLEAERAPIDDGEDITFTYVPPK